MNKNGVLQLVRTVLVKATHFHRKNEKLVPPLHRGGQNPPKMTIFLKNSNNMIIFSTKQVWKLYFCDLRIFYDIIYWFQMILHELHTFGILGVDPHVERGNRFFNFFNENGQLSPIYTSNGLLITILIKIKPQNLHFTLRSTKMGITIFAP